MTNSKKSNGANLGFENKDAKVSLSLDLDVLISDLRQMIDEARSAVAVTVNISLTLLYWRVGVRINKEILQGNRAEYGKQILATVSQQLTEQYGQGFSYSALTRMVKFSTIFPFNNQTCTDMAAITVFTYAETRTCLPPSS